MITELKSRWAKYFKPQSLTWWIGFLPIIAGAWIASDIDNAWIDPAADIIQAFCGGVDGSAMIYIGLGAIGLRGAL